MAFYILHWHQLLLFLCGLLALTTSVSACSGSKRRKPPPCAKRHCSVGGWGGWSGCSQPCGTAGYRARTRGKTAHEQCGGVCHHHLRETQSCNTGPCRACNGGRCQTTGGVHSSGCHCIAGFKGRCCNIDLDECNGGRGPCQHICINSFGSFACRCKPCYTKLGMKCELRMCSIKGKCYEYDEVNPSSPCQICKEVNKTSWSVNVKYGSGKCDDGDLCTRNDTCQSGKCVGIPFKCLPCQSCDGGACKLRPGFCLINGKCYRQRQIRNGYPCQECDTAQPHKWTSNNNLNCSDNNTRTKNDRCKRGFCWGEPYSCLSCQKYDGKGGCLPRHGNCVVQYGKGLACFTDGQAKPGNPCQVCNKTASQVSWTERVGGSCDDGDKCTRDDVCSKGQCIGQKVACTSPCQYCNGEGCGLVRGYGYEQGNCTCLIDGVSYHHQETNPKNPCLWCDLGDFAARKKHSWSIRPSLPCDDKDPCTKQDYCRNGECVGVRYSCGGGFPPSSCVEKSICNGDGKCRDVMKPRGSICRPATDECDAAERCDGKLGSCPQKSLNPIKFSYGGVVITNVKDTGGIAYQASLESLKISISGYQSSCGRASYSWYLLPGSSPCVAVSSTKGILAGGGPAYVIKGVPLEDKKTYKIAIQGTDIRNKTHPPKCYLPVTMDTSRPTDGWVNDGGFNVDIDFQSSKIIQASWGSFRARNGIAKYEWKVVYTEQGKNVSRDLIPFTSVNLNTRMRQEFKGIRDGGKVVIKVRAFTKAGLFTEASSDGVVIDTSPPAAGNIRDGASRVTDLRFANWRSSFHANWDPFVDRDTKVLHYLWGIERKGFGLMTPWRKTLRTTANTWLGLNLVSGETYCVKVRAVNEAGLITESSSNCVLIDNNPPKPGKVFDGVSNDIDHQTENRSLTANWQGFTDGPKGSGIKRYMYQIKDGGNKVIVPWRSLNDSQISNVTVTGLKLVNGLKYFVTIRAIDAVGLSTEVSSNGVVIDSSRPAFNGRVKVEGEADVTRKRDAPCVYVPSTTSLRVSWPGFTDVHTGIKRYEYAIVAANSNPLPSNFNRLIGLQTVTSYDIQNLTLQGGRRYQVVIRAYNNAGLYSDATSCVLIPDASPPLQGAITDGLDLNKNVNYQKELTSVGAAWVGFSDPESGIKEYLIAVGSCSKGNYHVTNNRFTPVKPNIATSVVLQVSLSNGQKYCIKLKAKNRAGIVSDEVSSDGFTVDGTSPQVDGAEVRDGPGDIDIDYQSSPTSLSATWVGFVDKESGIQRYEVGVTTNFVSQEPDAMTIPFNNVSMATKHTFKGLNLQQRVYYVIVCAINFVGLKSCVTSDGVLVDLTPPSKGVVYDGKLEPDIQYQAVNKSIAANWEGIWDAESGIKKFEWAIGTSLVNRTDVQDFVDVGLSTHVESHSNLSLRHGQRYFVSLKVTNQAGKSRELHSDGVTIDITPPIRSAIRPGKRNRTEWAYNEETKAFYSSSAQEISAHWDEFVEPESAVWFYKWAIGSQRCGTQIQPFVNVGRSTSATANSLRMLGIYQGSPFYVTVMAINRAGLVTLSCSGTLLLDKTPPRRGYVTVGTKPGVHRRFLQRNQTKVHWSEFTDPESGVDYCNVSISSNESDEHVKFFLGSKGSITYIPPQTNLKEGKPFIARVACINHAGLVSGSYSPSFIIDVSPPSSRGEIRLEGGSNGTMYFQSDIAVIKASWDHFKSKYSPITLYTISLGAAPQLADIVPYKDIGLVNKWEFQGLNLSHGSLYYVNVMAVNEAGLGSTVASKGILIDTTPPVKDRRSRIGFKDPESGTLKMGLCIGTTPLGCQICNLTNHSIACDHDSQSGEIIYFLLRVTNRAGLTTYLIRSLVFDETGPHIGDVQNKFGSILLRNSTISIQWHGVEDPESGVEKCEWMIKDEKSVVYYKEDVNATVFGQKVSLTVEWKTANLSVATPGVLLWNIIRCRNSKNMETFSNSSAFKIFSLPYPRPGRIRNGNSAKYHAPFSKSSRVVRANWDLFQADDLDPIVMYLWALGTKEGGQDVLHFTDVGLTTSVVKVLAEEKSGIDILKQGRKYFITVKAETESGLSSSTSAAFVVDYSPPDVEIKASHTVTKQRPPTIDVEITWKGSRDPDSGVKEVSYCLGYAEGDCIDNPKSASEGASSGLIHDVVLKEQRDIFVNVIVTNGAGLATVATKVVAIDVTPPLVGNVMDFETGREFINSSSDVTVTYSGFREDESNITKCEWSLFQEFNKSKKQVIFTQRVVASDGKASRSGLSLLPGFYRNKITCFNKDGFKSAVKSKGFEVDISAPVIGNISDGDREDSDIDYQSSLTTVVASWKGFRDFESGIHEYRVAIGDTFDDERVLAFESAGRNLSWTKTNLSLVEGRLYHVTVEAINGAGLISQGFSDGFLVDTTPPNVTMHSGPTWIAPSQFLSASWTAEDDESGLSSTEYCIGTTESNCRMRKMRRLEPNTTNITCYDYTPTPGMKYFILVRIWNQAGRFSVINNGGQTVDDTAPGVGRIQLDIKYTSCTKNCSFGFTATGFNDPESGLAGCDFAVKTAYAYVTEFRSFLMGRLATVTALNLTSGQRYYVEAKCKNNVGLESVGSSSDGFLVDSTPPTKGLVLVSPDRTYDVYGIHSFCHLVNEPLRIHWRNFTDQQSGVQGFQVAIGRAPYKQDLVAFFNVGLATDTFLNVGTMSNVTDGDVVYVTVACLDKAGLVTKGVSPPTRLINIDKAMLKEGNFYCMNF